MRLTPFAKFFITIVILAVVGYAVYHYKGSDVRKWATGGEKGTTTAGGSNVSSTDFAALKNAPPDPSRDAGSHSVAPVALPAGGRSAGRSSWPSTRGPATRPASSSTTASMATTPRTIARSTAWTCSSCL